MRVKCCSVHVNSYEFRARRKRQGLLISGRVLGPRPGRPTLVPEESTEPSVRVYRLAFTNDPDADYAGFDYLDPKPSPEWRTIRILLPADQEFIIKSRLRRAAPGQAG